jgi:AcrR family transcriptional regulator
VSDTATTPKRKRLKAADRRVAILRAARTVFVRSGLAGARIRDIADEAGVQEALLYKHFASKEEMFEAAIAQPLDDLIAEVTAITTRPMDVDTGVQRERTAEVSTRLLELMLDITPLLGTVLFADAERGRRFYREKFAPVLAAMSNVVTEGLGTWKHREFDPRLITTAATGMWLMLALDNHFGGNKIADPGQTARELTDVLFEGLLPRER